MQTTLRKVSATTVIDACNLEVFVDQRSCVVDVAREIAYAHYNAGCWYRLIYENDVIVGFIMWKKPNQELELLQLMIDRRYQGNGYGSNALHLMMNEVRAQNHGILKKVIVSCPNRTDYSPMNFFKMLGFREVIDQSYTQESNTKMVLEL